MVIVDGHVNLEIGLAATKESYDSSYSIPWYRQKKWRVITLVVGIIVIGASVGGAVGGIVAPNNTGSPPSQGSGPQINPLPNISHSSVAPSESLTSPYVSLVHSTPTPSTKIPDVGGLSTTSGPFMSSEPTGAGNGLAQVPSTQTPNSGLW